MLIFDQYHLFIFNLFVGAILGHIFYRSDFCMACMFRDVFLFKNSSLLRALLLLMVITMALFYGARLSGFILLHPSPTYSYPSAGTLVGGLMFGIGMVMAGG